MANIEEVIDVWRKYVDSINDWQQLVEDMEPKPSGCGPIYEFTTNPIQGRPNEDFCIADMRDLEVTEPHYHPANVTEVYFVIAGLGRVVVGNERPRDIRGGDIVVMPPLTAHYTLSLTDLVIAVVNTPPFKPEDYIPLLENDEAVQFDKSRFEKLVKKVQT